MNKVTFEGTVAAIERVTDKKYISGVGDKARFEDLPAGWKVVFVLEGGSRVGLVFCEDELPIFAADQKVRFTIEAL